MKSSIRLSLSLTGIAAFALAYAPLAATPAAADVAKTAQSTGTPLKSTSAEDLGVMEINLKDVVQPNYGFQGQLQGAGTPNEAGLGGFLPLYIGNNSVSFVDVLVNANFSDYGNDSSIINTKVSGTTFSTSTRLGYRWLNSNRSWMYGLNLGYDSRPMSTGHPDTGVTVINSRAVFFQQVAAGLEAVSNTWNFNAYALVPIGTTSVQLNSVYRAGSLDTYGLDVGYAITPDFNASLGYYYQKDNVIHGSGLLGRLAYNLSPGLIIGINYSYDSAFESRVSADLKYRFGANSYTTPSKKKAWQSPVIQSLSASVRHRDVRVHDGIRCSSPSHLQVFNAASCPSGKYYKT